MKPVLVDTSVWRRHFAGDRDARALSDLLDEDGVVLTHDFVIGEMVLGGLSESEESLFHRLPHVRTVPDQDALAFVRARGLARRGIGWVDVHLLASALAADATLWSFDKSLTATAADLGLSFAS